MKQQSPVRTPPGDAVKVPPSASDAPQNPTHPRGGIAYRLQRLTKRQKLLGLLGALVAVLLIVLVFGLGDDNTVDPSSSAGGSGHDGKVTVPGAAPALDPHPTGGAALGSKLDPFAATYGKPIETFSGNATFASNVSGSKVRIFVSLAAGNDKAEHVVGVHLAPDTGTWDIATATTIVTAFLPSDAHFVQSATTPDGIYYHIYQSGSAAQSLNAASFMFPNQTQGTAGKIAWYCDLNQGFCYVGTIAP